MHRERDTNNIIYTVFIPQNYALQLQYDVHRVIKKKKKKKKIWANILFPGKLLSYCVNVIHTRASTSTCTIIVV